jgi:cytochrome c553
MRKLLLPILAALALAGASATATAQDAKAGEKKAAMCIGCHGIPAYQASFPEVHKVPMISGQGAKYIVAALTGYKKGERRHPTMRGIAASLSDQDMADLAAYYSQQVKPGAIKTVAATTTSTPVVSEQEMLAKLDPAPSAQLVQLIKTGKCLTCHGVNFNNPIDPSYPKLAGQYADYLFVALKQYQTTKNPTIGRGNPVMNGVVVGLTPDQLKDLSRYLASLPSELQTVPQSRFR